MLLRLYEPILFRALSAANPAVRRNACALLVDVFPLQDPEADVEETDGLLARQAGIINQLMGDAAPAVRASAVEGICRILNTFWELVPAPTTAAFLAKLAGRRSTSPPRLHKAATAAVISRLHSILFIRHSST